VALNLYNDHVFSFRISLRNTHINQTGFITCTRKMFPNFILKEDSTVMERKNQFPCCQVIVLELGVIIGLIIAILLELEDKKERRPGPGPKK
jgi:uncharacterized protein YacL